VKVGKIKAGGREGRRKRQREREREKEIRGRGDSVCVCGGESRIVAIRKREIHRGSEIEKLTIAAAAVR